TGLDLTFTSATLADLTAAPPQTLPTALSLDTTGAVLTVGTVGTPAPALVDQHWYQVTVRAMSTSGKAATVTRGFLASGSAFTVPLPVTNLAITFPATVDYNTRTLGLSWTDSFGAATYNVYARDSGSNTGYVLVTTLPAPATSTVTTSVTLPAAFDSIVGGSQTPFDAATAVTLVVVPIDANGASGAFTSQTSVTVSDKTVPAVIGLAASASVDNSANATPKPVTLTFTVSEPMDKTAIPTVTLPFTSATTPVWTWGLYTFTATYDVTVPASTNGSGAITLTGGTDTSKNALTTYSGQLLAVSNPIVNGGLETWSFGTPSGWTTAGLVSSTAMSHSGAYAVQLGTSTPAVLTSSISQTFIAPAWASTLSFFYKDVCPDTVTYDWVTATLRDNVTASTTQVLAPTCTNFGLWVQSTFPIPAAMYGHSLTLTISSRDDGAAMDPSYTLVDDIVIQ
ncbi:MAG TPA: hypothetical protein VLT61_00665, partial [Anaeromyxobacteraceae bacterium]|nr:hypothetical protein [Anaeromyxobacteraceae bacterium]